MGRKVKESDLEERKTDFDYVMIGGDFKVLTGKEGKMKKNPKFIVEWEEVDTGDPIKYCQTEAEVNKKVLELSKDENVVDKSIKVHVITKTILPKVTVDVKF